MYLGYGMEPAPTVVKEQVMATKRLELNHLDKRNETAGWVMIAILLAVTMYSMLALLLKVGG